MEILKKLTPIPWGVKSFLFKALLLFIAWKVLYLVFLYPKRIVDAPLTLVVANGTASTLNLISSESPYTVTHESDQTELAGTIQTEELETINFHNEKTLSIADKCNALEVFVLFAGFIVCFPALTSRKLIFITVGIFAIFIFNILRCVALTLVCIHYPNYVEISHHYIFNIIIYLFIFWLWYLFSKKLTLHAAQ